jgi:tetratricopeptide (TPR) repeat protein
MADIDKVKKFRITKDEELKPVLEFGGWGEGQGEFMLPQGIDIDQEGCIYVADTLNNRIQKFSPRGKFLLAIVGLDKPMGVAVTGIGDIWVLENGAHRLQRFIPEIEVVIPKEIAKEDNYEWLYNRGRTLQSSKMFYHAIAYYKKCIEIKPDSTLAPKAQLQIARSFRGLGNFETAFMAYEEVVKNYPRSNEAPRALIEKGKLLEELGFFEQAKTAYERLVEEYPDSKENKKAEKRIEYIEGKILGG